MDATAHLKAEVVKVARQCGLSVEQVIIEFVAATLITSSNDPAHVDGIAFAKGLESQMRDLSE